MQYRILALGCAVVLAAATATHAQQYVYAVNYECGFQSSADGNGGYEPVVKVANYAIKFDLYNPGGGDANLTGSVSETSTAHWVAQAGADRGRWWRRGDGCCSQVNSCVK